MYKTPNATETYQYFVKEWMEWGVSWMTSELSASTLTSGRLQPRTGGNSAERQNKGPNISWRSGPSQRKPRLDYGMLQ